MVVYYVMAQAVRPLANSCEHNSYSFQWMVLKPRIVTHFTFICPFLTEL